MRRNERTANHFAQNPNAGRKTPRSDATAMDFDLHANQKNAHAKRKTRAGRARANN
jgi:hypothetical protein